MCQVHSALIERDSQKRVKVMLAIREEQVGASHPHIATYLNNMAALYQSRGRSQEAESFLQRAITICEEQVGTSHPETATSLNNLATLYVEQSRSQEAELLLRRAVTISRASLGLEHHQTQLL